MRPSLLALRAAGRRGGSGVRALRPRPTATSAPLPAHGGSTAAFLAVRRQQKERAVATAARDDVEKGLAAHAQAHQQTQAGAQTQQNSHADTQVQAPAEPVSAAHALPALPRVPPSPAEVAARLRDEAAVLENAAADMCAEGPGPCPLPSPFDKEPPQGWVPPPPGAGGVGAFSAAVAHLPPSTAALTDDEAAEGLVVPPTRLHLRHVSDEGEADGARMRPFPPSSTTPANALRAAAARSALAPDETAGSGGNAGRRQASLLGAVLSVAEAARDSAIGRAAARAVSAIAAAAFVPHEQPRDPHVADAEERERAGTVNWIAHVGLPSRVEPVAHAPGAVALAVHPRASPLSAARSPLAGAIAGSGALAQHMPFSTLTFSTRATPVPSSEPEPQVLVEPGAGLVLPACVPAEEEREAEARHGRSVTRLAPGHPTAPAECVVDAPELPADARVAADEVSLFTWPDTGPLPTQPAQQPRPLPHASVRDEHTAASGPAPPLRRGIDQAEAGPAPDVVLGHEDGPEIRGGSVPRSYLDDNIAIAEDEPAGISGLGSIKEPRAGRGKSALPRAKARRLPKE